MKTVQLLSVVFLGVSSFAFASGYRCTGNGTNVKIYNHVNPEDGTRSPHILIISDDVYGTLTVAKDEEISKNRVGDAVEFAISGPYEMGFEAAVLRVEHLEGRGSLEEGATVPGKLTFLRERGDDESINMVCSRYLKSQD